jgi:predicted branched-subunit amino acid permease
MDTDGRPADRGYAAGVRAGVPFAVATVVLGVSFGVLAGELGWGVAAPIVCSAVVLSGSAQFAAASILGVGGGVGAATLAAVVVNARFLPMGLALAPSLVGGRLRRAAEGQLVVDASWALANRGDGTFERRYLIGATLPQLGAWIGGTALGAAGGGVLGDPEALGLDVVFPVFFLILLAEELGDRQAGAVAVLGGLIALALVRFAPPGVPVVAACGAALLAPGSAWWWTRVWPAWPRQGWRWCCARRCWWCWPWRLPPLGAGFRGSPRVRGPSGEWTGRVECGCIDVRQPCLSSCCRRFRCPWQRNSSHARPLPADVPKLYESRPMRSFVSQSETCSRLLPTGLGCWVDGLGVKTTLSAHPRFQWPQGRFSQLQRMRICLRH